MADVGQILDLLDRDDALELWRADEDFQWPEPGEDEAAVEVDHSRLFPRHRPSDRGSQDFDLYGDDWDLSGGVGADILGGLDTDAPTQPPEWDVWAWYQPIHFFGPAWGIFIRESGLLLCARQIAAELIRNRGMRSPAGVTFAKAVVRAAFAALFLHEHYHHKTESLALRLHVVERRPIYVAYHRSAYRPAKGTPDQVEEGLANADSWRRMTEPIYTRWTGPSVTEAARLYLERSFRRAPPGYANATHLLANEKFEREQQRLFARVQEGHVAPTRSVVSDFGIATHLNHSLFNVSQRIWTIVPRGRSSILPTRAPVALLTTARLERFVSRRGWSLVPGGKGSHRKYRASDGRMIILPDRKDVSWPVLKATAETLGVSMHELTSMA